MPQIISLLSQYGILYQTAQNLSTLDLFHLALTCSQFNNLVLKSESVFQRLKFGALCDGHGLKIRQEYKGLYRLPEYCFIMGKGSKAHYDEEIEVRVWNLNCDSVNGLPCVKCGVNVCEECRYAPRVRDTPYYRSCRWPHQNPAYELFNIICYCKVCDDEAERHLPLSLSEYCDCDQYKRWICQPCKKKENQEDGEYQKTRTEVTWEDDGEQEDGMRLHDHQSYRMFWCPCGERSPKGGNVRCSWCRKKHNLETWRNGDGDEIPFFDEDPCYPVIRWDRHGDQLMYPPLGYNGPIFQ